MTTVAGTSVPVTVLHRLALGVVLRDHVTQRPPLGRPTVWREGPDQRQQDHPDLRPDLRPLETWGGSRFKYRYDLTAAFPDRALSPRLRVTDSRGYYVPRRVDQRVRPLDEVEAGDQGLGSTPVPVAHRMIELWLFPGPGYPLPSGATVLRGQILRDGEPVPWPRVGLQRDQSPTVLGWTHGDDQGQFLIPLSSVRPTNRLRGPFTVRIEAPPVPLEPVVPPGSSPFEVDRLRALDVIALPDLVDPPATPTPTTAESRGEYAPGNASTSTASLPGDIPLGRVRTETITI